MPDDNAKLEGDFQNLLAKYDPNKPSEHEEHLGSWAASAAWGHLQSGIKTVGSVAEGVAEDNPATNALVGLISGKTSPAVQGKLEGVGKVTGEDYSNPQYSKNPIARHLEAGLVSGGVSLGEWGTFGKIAEGSNFITSKSIEAISPEFRQALTKSALATKLSQGVSGAIGGGAATAALNAAEGRHPSEGVGTNMLITGLLGAASRHYSPETNARISKSAQTILNASGEGGKRFVGDLSALIDEVGKTSGGWSPQDTMDIVKGAFQGTANAVQKETIRSHLEKNPELMTHPIMRQLWDHVNDNGKAPGIWSEAQMTEFLDAQEGGDVLSSMFGGKFKGYEQDIVGRSGFPRVDLEHDAGFPNVQPAPGKEIPRPEPFGTEVKLSFPSEGSLPGERSVRVGPETAAGIPVSAPNIRYALPSGADPKTDIPAAPRLTPPNSLTPSQKEIFTAAKGNDWSKLEKLVTKGKGSAQGFEKMITGDILRPEHIMNADVARQIAGHLLDRTEALSPDSPKFHQLMEAADGFIDRSDQLRGVSAPARGQFVREMESGDIVRTSALDADNSILTDKHGKSAIVANKDLPPKMSPQVQAKYDELVARAGEVAAQQEFTPERLKQLEQSLGSNDNPPPAVPPKNKAGFLFPTDKGGLTGFSKGAITFKRPGVKEITDRPNAPVVVIVKKLGGKVYETPEGIVTKIGGVEQKWPDEDSAVFGLRSAVTELRKNAEFHQVVNESIKNDKIPLQVADKPTQDMLHKALRVASKLSAQDEKGLPTLKNALVGPLIERGKGKFTRAFMTQLGILKNMGEGGKDLASDTLLYHYAEESLQASWLTKNLAQNLDTIKQSGLTTSQLRAGQGDPAAVKLFQQTVSPILDALHKNGQALGIAGESIFDRAGNVDKVYVPLTWDYKPEDVDSPELLAEAKELGLPSKPDELAAKLNTGADRKTSPQGRQWLNKVSSSMAGNLEKARRGNVGYNEDIKTNVTRAIIRGSKRLAEAAVFGPNLEKANNHIGRIEGFANNQLAQGILEDSLGRHNTAAGSGLTFLMDMARGKLTGSWTKHIIQYPMMGAREGFLPLVEGFTKTLAHPMMSHHVASQIGAIIERVRFDVVNGDYTDNGGVLNAVGKTVSNIGGFPLHKFVNALRTVGTEVMKASFDHHFDKALTGDADALAHISDIFGKKLKVEDLQAFDKNDLREAAMKIGTDRIAGSFRPLDMPAISREPGGGPLGSVVGKAMTQFSAITYQLARNTIEPIVNPNMSRAARVKALARVAVAAPAGTLLSAYLSSKVMGTTNMGQKELLSAFDDLTKDIHKKGFASIDTARQAIFTELQSLVLYEVFGAVSSLAQAAFTGASWRDFERSTTSAPVAASVLAQGADAVKGGVDLVLALGKGAHGSLLQKQRAKKQLVDSLAGIFGSATIGLVRGKGALAGIVSEAKQALGGKPYKGLPHKEAKPPKHQPLREFVTGRG